jgi:hypothetical protein
MQRAIEGMILTWENRVVGCMGGSMPLSEGKVE